MGINDNILEQHISFYLCLILLLFCNVHVCLTSIDGTFEFGGVGDLPFMATAFVQTGNELHYFSDVEYHESIVIGAPVKSNDENGPILNNQLQFTPKELSFGEQSMSIPQQREVRIYNPTASSVRFDAISGSTVHFHCSFPEHKTVNPGGVTTFNVVFLPRQEGAIENVLFVHSSLGTFTYTVKGRGTPNVYRVRPYVGARVPVNGTFVSPVELHNPHPTTLRVTEVYSSGGDLHLELPQITPGVEYTASLWQIAPYETKTVINARLLGAHERNSTAYIKIKTDRQVVSEKNDSYTELNGNRSHVEETLIIPLEMEITKKRGLYPTVEVLDFGLIKAGERSNEKIFEVVSTLEKGIEIEALYVERSGESNGIYLEFASKPPISVKCGARQQPGAPKAIAKVTLDTKVLRRRKNDSDLIRCKGRIIAESKGGVYNISVPYIALVYYGSLQPRVEETAFHNLLKAPISRSVSFTSRLPFGIAVWRVTLEASASKSFLAKLLSNVIVLAPGETKPIVYLKYISKEKDGFLSHFILHTNVTTFKIPIVIFNGKLEVTLSSIDQTNFDFGLMNVGDVRSIQFVIKNGNPVAVTVRNIRRALPSFTSLELLGTEAGSGPILSNLQHRNDWAKMWQEAVDFVLPGQSFAVFKYSLKAPAKNMLSNEALRFETDFEKKSFYVNYTIDEGVIISVPERLVFNRSFPGKISSHALRVFSSFKDEMCLQRITSITRERQIFYEITDTISTSVIKPGTISNLGRVHFVPGANCVDGCYVGMPLHTADGQWFTYGMKLPQNLAEIDSYLYSKLRRKYLLLKSEGKTHVNTTIVIDTDKAKHLTVPLTAELIWPKLLTHSTVHFPLTAVGNFTIVNLTLTNPSSYPVVVQLLPLVIYPDADILIDFFRNELDSPLTDPIEMNETLMFSLRDTELFTLKPDSPVPKLREHLENILGISIPKFTLSMLLQPGMKVRVRVGFLPSDYSLRSSLLLIRNNLTVLEPVVLYGRGARMDMQVEGRAARTREPLLFEIQPHHLTDCHNPKRLTHKLITTLTVKRSFTIENTGEIAFTIVNMSINNVACENRGFRVLNCGVFRLAPHEKHILDIAYTPDFLMSWNEAALQFYMHMNGTSWLFPIGASVPRHMLSKCYAALPRPPFESLMYYSCVSALTFCLICVVACAYLEGDRTISCALRQQFCQNRRVFDLNSIDVSQFNRNSLTPSPTIGYPQTSSPRRHVLHYSEDSNMFIRSFWQIANRVLWLFSFVWRFRDDETNVQVKTKVRKTRALVRCQEEPSIYMKPLTSSEKSLSPPSHSSSGGNSGGIAVASKRSNAKNALQPNSSTKNLRTNGDCRSGKEKAKNETIFMEAVIPSTRPAKDKKDVSEKNHKRLGRSQSNTKEPSPESQDNKPSRSIGNDSTKKQSMSRNSTSLTRDGMEGARISSNNHRLITAAVQTSPTIEKGRSWRSVCREKSIDERSDTTCLSDSPEWDNDPLPSGDFNTDEDFIALSEATERLFELESKPTYTQKFSQPRQPIITVVRPLQPPQVQTIDQKQEYAHNSISASPRGSGDFEEAVSSWRKELDNFSSSRFETYNDHRTTGRTNDKPDGTRPSSFIEQLQRERKIAEDQYLKKSNELKSKEDEVWPGFNLKLPALSENLFDRECSHNKLNESVWQLPSISPSSSSAFPRVPPMSSSSSSSSSGGDSSASLKKAIKAFRLNPKAPPFEINSTSKSPLPIIPKSEDWGRQGLVTEASTHSANISIANTNPIRSMEFVEPTELYIDDPLGLSGSLFGRGGRTNIWANDPSSSGSALNRPTYDDVMQDSAAVYWAEKLLRDEDNKK